MPPLTLRPTEVLQAYWESILAIEEDALFLDPIYFTLEVQP